MLGRLGNELGIQQHLLPRTWDREKASRAHWEMGLGGQQSCSISISGESRVTFGSEHQREAALAAGCLAELILVALLALSLILCPLSWAVNGLISHSFSSRSTAGSCSRHWFSASAGQGFVHVPTAGQ